MGCLLQPADAVRHARSDRDLSAYRADLHFACVSGFARRRDVELRRKEFVQPLLRESKMWYFTWVLGVGFACGCGILNALWHEYHMPDDKLDG